MQETVASSDETEVSDEIRSNSPEQFEFKKLPSVLWDAVKVWNEHNPWRLGAVVAYYALLSLPGLLIVVINAVGAIWGEQIVQGEITDQIADVVGEDVAKSVQSMLEITQDNDQSMLMTIVGVGVLLFAATGVFYHLQLSLNEIWDVRQAPSSNILKLLIDRAVSFGFVLVIGFLLLVSFVISAGLSAMSGYLSSIWEPGWIVAAQVIDFVITTGVVMILFSLIFKYLPDARVQWGIIVRGAFVTAVLFNIGVFLLGYYFGKAEPGSMYGAAGSVVALLLWISYACLILFYGAALIRVYAEQYGRGLDPRESAMLIRHEERILKTGKKESAA